MSSTVESENKALIRRWFDEVWTRGRIQAIDQLRSLKATAVGLGEGDTIAHGPDPFKAFFLNLRATLPDLKVTIEDLLAEGDKVAVRYSVEGTHQGEALASPATGQKIRFTGITIARVEGGKIVQGWNNLDQLGLLTQLGLLPVHVGPDRFLTRRA
jgi:predicted ester cyclase